MISIHMYVYTRTGFLWSENQSVYTRNMYYTCATRYVELVYTYLHPTDKCSY